MQQRNLDLGISHCCLDLDDVEYYLEISVDGDIPQAEVCQSLDKLKARNIYLDIDYDCAEAKRKYNTLDVNLYRSPVEDVEDCE